MIEQLESRVLLAASVIDAVQVSWNGNNLQAARNQYVVQSSLGSATALRNYLVSQGLHPGTVQSLAFNGFGSQYYLVHNSVDSLGNLNWWATNKSGGVVSSFAPNFVNRARLSAYETQPGLAQWAQNLWHLNNDGTSITTDPFNQPVQAVPGADINAVNAWDLGTGNPNIIVAVLDTGSATYSLGDAAHPDLIQNAFLNPGDPIDTVDNDGNGVIDDLAGANFTTLDATTGAIVPDNLIYDLVGHGTHVAGIIGAMGHNLVPTLAANGYPMVGVNWRVQIMPVKVLDDTGAGTDAMVIAGINYVTYMKQIRGFNIVAANMSLGRPFAGPSSGLADPTLGATAIFQALTQMNNAGVILTGAVGNDAWNIGNFADIPGSYSNPLSLSVAATDASDNLSLFSNFGAPARIAAPGTAIFSTISLNSPLTDVYGSGPPHQTSGYAVQSYAVLSGTSMAAPMVAGAVALLRSIAPNASPQQIVNAIIAGADVLPQLQGKVSTSARIDVFRSAQILLGNRPVIGNVERITGNEVSGWAFDPNMGAKQVSGVVVVDGVTSIPFVTSLRRPDVDAIVYSDEGRRRGHTARGFTVNLGNIGPGQHRIEVYFNDVSHIGGVITNPDGSFIQTTVLNTSRIIEGNLLPIGNVDIANAQQIAGWAWDPNSNGGSINVRIDIDGQQVAVVPANQFHSPAVGNQGFFYTPTLSQGSHRVDVYALDDFTQQAVLIGTRTIFTNSQIITGTTGLNFDPTTNILSGYVVDPNSPFDPVSLQIVIDGQSGGARQFLNAVASNPDPTNAARIGLPTGNENHGFSIKLPNLSPGNHTIQVFAYDAETGARVEVLQAPVFVNVLPKGRFYPVNNNLIGEWAMNVFDPNSPGTPVKYRVDIDNWTGPLRQAPTNEFNFEIFEQDLSNPLLPPTLLEAGNHTVRLWVVDNETLELVQITENFFGQNAPTQNFVEPDFTNPARRATGNVDVLQTINGISYFNQAQTLGISGVATDPNNGTRNSGALIVSLLLDGNSNAVAQVFTQPGVGNRFIFTPTQLLTAVPPGIHYAQVVVEDLDGARILIGQGELVIQSTNPDLSDPARNIAAGVIKDANLQTISGTVQANVNEPVPATFANLGGIVASQPTFRVDVNNQQFVIVRPPTPTVPGQGFDFTVNTPQLNSSVNNVARIFHFDPLIGVLRPVATRPLDPTRAFNFINRRLNLSGNMSPSGNLEAASANGIAGWVRDADAPGQAILYRLDIDDSVGIPQLANLNRPDLPFTAVANDQKHGFSVVPPSLTAGTHTVRLWAIDPITLQTTLVGTRSFTVVDDANRRPIGTVDILNGSRIAGWVQDPTTPGWAVAIELRVDGVVVGTFPASTPRGDVNRNGAFATGFDFPMPGNVAAGRHVVEVFAVDTTDASRKVMLRSASVEVGAPQVSGSFDVANFEGIAGWGRAAAGDANPRFRLDVNDVPFQTFEGAPSNEAGMSLRRFVFPSPPMGVSYNNVVSLYYIDPITRNATLVATRVIGPVQPTVGTIDNVNTAVIQGWAFSPSLPSAKITVQLLIDNVEVAITTASLDRPDLTGREAGHAYQFNVPTLSPGRHTIAVRFRDPITGDYSLVSSTVTLTV